MWSGPSSASEQKRWSALEPIVRTRVPRGRCAQRSAASRGCGPVPWAAHRANSHGSDRRGPLEKRSSSAAGGSIGGRRSVAGRVAGDNRGFQQGNESGIFIWLSGKSPIRVSSALTTLDTVLRVFATICEPFPTWATRPVFGGALRGTIRRRNERKNE